MKFDRLLTFVEKLIDPKPLSGQPPKKNLEEMSLEELAGLHDREPTDSARKDRAWDLIAARARNLHDWQRVFGRQYSDCDGRGRSFDRMLELADTFGRLMRVAAMSLDRDMAERVLERAGGLAERPAEWAMIGEYARRHGLTDVFGRAADQIVAHKWRRLIDLHGADTSIGQEATRKIEAIERRRQNRPTDD
ncbi:hypothetical protein ACFL26_00890 [Patescibacteria group bacterium]